MLITSQPNVAAPPNAVPGAVDSRSPSSLTPAAFKTIPAKAGLPYEPLRIPRALRVSPAGSEGWGFPEIIQHIENGTHAAAPFFSEPRPGQTESRLHTLAAAHRQNAVIQARLQFQSGTLSAKELAQLEQLASPDASTNVTTPMVSDLIVGDEQRSVTLNGILLIASPQQPSVLLYVPGSDGGLERFDSLADMKKTIGTRLRDPAHGYLLRQIAPPGRGQLTTYLNQMPAHEVVQINARPVSGEPFEQAAKAQADNFQKGLGAITRGVQLYPDMPDEQAMRERLGLETALNFKVTRGQGDGLISVENSLPQWLAKGGAALRQDYADRLKDYLQANVALEAQLQESLPSLQLYASSQLRQAFSRDGLPETLDPAAIFIELPVSVRQDTNPFKGWQNKYKVSDQRRSFSLAQLACMNIDTSLAAEMLRFNYARLVPEPNDPRLNIAYLIKTIPALDVGQKYQQSILEAFHGKAHHPGSGNAPPTEREALLQPFQQKIQLEGWAAKQQGLGEKALNMLEKAATARRPEDLKSDGLDLKMHYVALHLGGPLDAEGAHMPLRGLCFLVDKTSGHTVLYLPDAPGGRAVTEHADLASARKQLFEFLALPEMAAYAADRIEPGQPLKNLAEHIRKTSALGQNLVEVGVSAPHHSLADFQAYGRITHLLQETHQQARTGLDIWQAKHEARHETLFALGLTALGFVPGIGQVISIYDIWHAIRALRTEPAEEFESMTASHVATIISGLIDVALGTHSALKNRPALRTKAPKLDVHKALAALSDQSHGRPGFQGYGTQLPESAHLIVKGADKGLWQSGSELFIVTDQPYQVYRRTGEQVLRLKKANGKHYEPPIRSDGSGGWAYDLEVGLPGKQGPKSFAELLVKRTGPNGRVQVGLLASPLKAPRFTEPSVLHPLTPISDLTPAYAAELERAQNIKFVNTGLIAATAPDMYTLVRQKLQHSRLALIATQNKLAAVPQTAATKAVLKTYFGEHILDNTAKMKRVRERLNDHLTIMANILREYLKPAGLSRIALYNSLKGPLEHAAFIIEGDPVRKLFLNTDYLDEDLHLLHEVAHHATLKEDFWYINDASTARMDWEKNNAASNAILNKPKKTSPADAHPLVLEIASDWPPYQDWYKKMTRSSLSAPDPAQYRIKQADKLFRSDPVIRSAVAAHNPDNMAYAILALGEAPPAPQKTRLETAI